MGRQQASKIYKTKRYSKDTDQILHSDLVTETAIQSLKHQKFDEHLPGLGQHYCIPCAKHYESEIALKTHTKSKVHKRQLKNLKFGPYSHEEAESGAGRDVAKFLRLKEEQNNLLAQNVTKTELQAEKKNSHIKAKNQSSAMDMDENDATNDEPEAEPEVTV